MTAREPASLPDPSMEDILASIREILNEDEKAITPAEPLQLTEAMLVAPPQPQVAPSVDMDEEPVAEPAPPQQPMPLLAPAVAAATAAALGELARAVAGNRAAPVSRGGASIEDVVRDEIRPLLKAWLDEHLPGMVQHIVKAEIARLMGRGEG